MAKPNQVPESSMEEILASIRKIISEDESRTVGPKPTASTKAEPAAPLNNVSRLFREQPAEMPALEEEVAIEPAPTAELHETKPQAQRREEEKQHTPAEAPERVSSSAEHSNPPSASPETKRPLDEPRAPSDTGALLSPQTNVAVASAFSHLANSILSNNSRTIEQLAEDMMRPMLRSWLDDNLPPLVERLVREEIERVSRRR